MALTQNEQDNDATKLSPPLLFMLPMVAGALLHTIFGFSLLSSDINISSGVPFVALGVVLVTWSVWLMRDAGTTPQPGQPTTALVTTGPFRFSRNPIYVAYVPIYVGTALVVNSLTVLLFLPVAVLLIQRVVIRREEQYLENKFGQEYLDYKSKVRRWL